MRHLKAHRKLGRSSEHRISLLRNLATSLLNARDERLVTTLPKAKELRPFVERAITLSRKAANLDGEGAAARSAHPPRPETRRVPSDSRAQAASARCHNKARSPRTAAGADA